MNVTEHTLNIKACCVIFHDFVVTCCLFFKIVLFVTKKKKSPLCETDSFSPCVSPLPHYDAFEILCI